MNVSDGMNYAPQGKPQPVVGPGEFVFSAAHIDHGHIYGMCNGLTEAGGTIKYVYDPDPKKVEAFLKAYEEVKEIKVSASMKKDELIAVAKANNIEVDEKATKAVIIETIEAALK